MFEFLKKKKPDPEPEPKPGCQRCGNRSLLNVTCLGDAQPKFLCGECGWRPKQEESASA